MSCYRHDTSATYDRTLLSNIPNPTLAQKEVGYNLNLLNEGRARLAPNLPEGPPLDQHGVTYGQSPEVVAHKDEQLENGVRKDVIVKVPWYRTRWGIKAIVIAVLLIIVVGGAVGGTHHRSHPQNNSANGNNTNTITTGNIPQQQPTSSASVSGQPAAVPSSPQTQTFGSSTTSSPSLNFSSTTTDTAPFPPNPTGSAGLS